MEPQTALEILGDHNADSVDIETLKVCFPAIFATFADLGEWQILSALEGAFMDEKRATRNLKAKIKQAKELGVDLKAAERIQNQKFIQKREAADKVRSAPAARRASLAHSRVRS